MHFRQFGRPSSHLIFLALQHMQPVLVLGAHRLGFLPWDELVSIVVVDAILSIACRILPPEAEGGSSHAVVLLREGKIRQSCRRCEFAVFLKENTCGWSAVPSACGRVALRRDKYCSGLVGAVADSAGYPN